MRPKLHTGIEKCVILQLGNLHNYRTCAIITRSRFETTLDYKPRIFKVRKVSLQTALQYKPRLVKLSKIEKMF